ncbi:hypothetical protein POP12_137 [Pectobacterium phage POP12]|nr:hypothetical protein POP12_137 [Pectobacterium phage POP12]
MSSMNFEQAMKHLVENKESKVTIYGRKDFYVYFEHDEKVYYRQSLKFPYALDEYNGSKYDEMCSWVLYIKENPIKKLIRWGFGFYTGTGKSFSPA